MAERIEDIFFNNLKYLGKAEIRVRNRNWENILDFSIRKNCDEKTFTTIRCINGEDRDTQIKQSFGQLREFIRKMSLELEDFGEFEKAIVNGSEIILKI